MRELRPPALILLMTLLGIGQRIQFEIRFRSFSREEFSALLDSEEMPCCDPS